MDNLFGITQAYSAGIYQFSIAAVTITTDPVAYTELLFTYRSVGMKPHSLTGLRSTTGPDCTAFQRLRGKSIFLQFSSPNNCLHSDFWTRPASPSLSLWYWAISPLGVSVPFPFKAQMHKIAWGPMSQPQKTGGAMLHSALLSRDPSPQSCYPHPLSQATPTRGAAPTKTLMRTVTVST